MEIWGNDLEPMVSVEDTRDFKFKREKDMVLALREKMENGKRKKGEKKKKKKVARCPRVHLDKTKGLCRFSFLLFIFYFFNKK